MNILAHVKSLLLTACTALSLATAAAQAAVVTSQVGTDDGFGIGVRPGETFFPGDLVEGTGFNQWHIGGFDAQLPAAWSGRLTAAHLDVFSGGWGLGGRAQVYLGGSLIGLLSDGDFENRGDNFAVLDRFDLAGVLDLIGPSNDIAIRTRSPDDSGVLGFMRLVLQTDDAGTPGTAVPEPATLFLIVAAGGAALRPRRRKS